MLPDSPELLKALLEPLLEDFQYWFSRSEKLLSSDLKTVTREQRLELLARVQQSRQAVTATQSLFTATAGTVGVESSILLQWHQLVTECWLVARRERQQGGGETHL